MLHVTTTSGYSDEVGVTSLVLCVGKRHTVGDTGDEGYTILDILESKIECDSQN